MSEYQYYEFLAIDRPLDRAAQDALRSISSRARITATSFANHYEWGDLKGDPGKFMERWFDLHLYVANWGTRRLMIRVPKRFLSRADIEPFLGEIDWVKVSTANDNLIIDICHQEEGAYDDWEDGSSRLAGLAPLRSDVLSGDLRLFYLLWLTAVENELVPDEEVEPLQGLAPLTGPLKAFAEFFYIDRDLVEAAAEQGQAHLQLTGDALRKRLAAIPDHEKVEFLMRIVEGDALAGVDLKGRLGRTSPRTAHRRTAGTLRIRAEEIRRARERADAERRAAGRRREAAAAEKALRVRLKALKQRGATVWDEIGAEIERRNAAGYEVAMGLLSDLQVLAREEGSEQEFNRRLGALRTRHEKKGKFIERLNKLGRDEEEAD
jgi:hypothetical protein